MAENYSREKMAPAGVYGPASRRLPSLTRRERLARPHFEKKMSYDIPKLLKKLSPRSPIARKHDWEVHSPESCGRRMFFGSQRKFCFRPRTRVDFPARQDADFSIDDEGDYFLGRFD